MNLLQYIFPAKRRVRRKRRAGSSGSPVTALTLVSAEYDAGDGPVLFLTFDRAIDVSAMDVTSVVVDDGEFNTFRYQGINAPTLSDPNTVRLELNGIDEDTHPGVHLSVGADNGIVAVDDGGTWAGVINLALPYP